MSGQAIAAKYRWLDDIGLGFERLLKIVVNLERENGRKPDRVGEMSKTSDVQH